MARLAEEYGIRPEELTTDTVIMDERSLVVSILSFLQSGTGGERFVASPDIIEHFAWQFENKVTLGGTPIRAAIAIDKLGYQCVLHLITMNDHVRRLFSPPDAYICSSKGEHVYPHLIVQYHPGVRVQTSTLDLCAQRANRIIYDNDPESIQMALNENLARFCPDAKVFLISGFNAMQDAGLLQKRLDTVKRIIAPLPDSAIVYYEDGGFHNASLRAVIRDRLETNIDIHSMNEDELQGFLGRKLDLLNAREITDAVKQIAAFLGTRTVLVHTQHWALVYGQNARQLCEALDGGITLAGTRYRLGDDFTKEQYLQTAALPRVEDGARFAKEINTLLGEKICCLPSFKVTESNVTTVGLGDAFVGGFLAKLSDSKIVFQR